MVGFFELALQPEHSLVPLGAGLDVANREPNMLDAGEPGACARASFVLRFSGCHVVLLVSGVSDGTDGLPACESHRRAFFADL
jgi:hypothetical protein